MGDFIPEADAQFNIFITAFGTFVGTHGTALGLSAGEMTAFDGLLSDWATDYAAHLDRQTQAQAATATKETTRAGIITEARSFAARFQNHPDMTDAFRAEAHLPIYDSTRTRVAVPATRPLVVVDASQRLQHTLSWRDESTPTAKAKPAGVAGAEIWVAIAATPPADPAQYHFQSLDTATPYLLHHDAADGGKMAHYLLRWVNTRNEPGPWSETVSATIGA